MIAAVPIAATDVNRVRPMVADTEIRDATASLRHILVRPTADLRLRIEEVRRMVAVRLRIVDRLRM